MVATVTPILGTTLGRKPEETSIQLGTIVTGVDGHEYIYAQASGSIANNAVCALTENTMTMAADAGGEWTNTSGALVAGNRAYFKRTDI